MRSMWYIQLRHLRGISLALFDDKASETTFGTRARFFSIESLRAEYFTRGYVHMSRSLARFRRTITEGRQNSFLILTFKNSKKSF